MVCDNLIAYNSIKAIRADTGNIRKFDKLHILKKQENSNLKNGQKFLTVDKI